MNELIGKIAVIELPKRHLVVMDKDSILHPYTCVEPLDVVLQKQKVGYFVKVTVDGDLCKKIEYAPRPADWPFKVAGKPFVPRNEHLIVHQTTYKECCDTVRCLMLVPEGTFDEEEFNRIMDIALARSLKDAKALIEAGELK